MSEDHRLVIEEPARWQGQHDAGFCRLPMWCPGDALFEEGHPVSRRYWEAYTDTLRSHDEAYLASAHIRAVALVAALDAEMKRREQG